MSRVRIATDSTSDVPPDVAARLRITVAVTTIIGARVGPEGLGVAAVIAK